MDEQHFDDLISAIDDAERILTKADTPLVSYSIPEVNIRKAREKMRLNQAAFAELLGIRLNTLQLLEKGRRRPSTVIMALCRLIVADPDFVRKTLTAPAIAHVSGDAINEEFDVSLGSELQGNE